MKFLLISTLGKNIGDEFARMGVENLLCKIRGPGDTVEVICKESIDVYKPRKFDRAILCGMPLFWSLENNECQDIDWWKPIIRGWVSDSRKKFAVVGAGSVIVDEIHNPHRYVDAISEVVDRAAFVTTRQPVMDHPLLIDSICPSAFCYSPFQEFSRDLKLCNIMPDGGHNYCPTQKTHIRDWKMILPDLVPWLLAKHFIFVAHTLPEKVWALQNGWPSQRVMHFDSPEEYLSRAYSRCDTYIGNRLHGAAVASVAGGRALGIAGDNRIKMVKLLGAHAVRPSETSFEQIVDWHNNAVYSRVDCGWERERLVRLLTQFIRQ